MTLVIKRAPIDPTWPERAACKYRDPDLWDMDNSPRVWKAGRRICITECTVRDDCLRTALQAEGGTVGVVAGAQKFTADLSNKKRSQCLLCGYFMAPLKLNKNKEKIPTLCWVCRRYAPCLNQCGRLVPRRIGMDSYYCRFCAN